MAPRALLALLSLALALGVLEIGVRVFAPQPPLLYQPHPTLGWTHVPNTALTYPGHSGPVRVAFNGDGLRMGEPRGGRRIVVLGDSYTEGVDVAREDTFVEQAGRCLGVDMVNAGVGGYGPDQQWLWLREHGQHYRPEAVVIAFTVANDVFDVLGKGWCREDGERVVCERPRGRDAIVHAKAWAQRHLHAYGFVQSMIARSGGAQVLLARLGVLEVAEASAMPAELRMLMRDDEDRERGWRLTERVLAEIVRASPRAILLVVPSELQADERPLARAVFAHGVTGAMDLEGPQRRLAAFAAQHGVTFLDPLPRLREAIARGETIYRGHWTARGHAIVGQALCNVALAR